MPDPGHCSDQEAETNQQLTTVTGVLTPFRYVEATVRLLSARLPKLGQALREATRDGLHYLVLDGTLIHTD
ncbi:hypothetical protein GCM10010176_087350 [Nonomuraea spiralis]|nr:hypothetical protein GCM10010176_087350 [Nonomuraea spiralis]